MNYEFMRYGIEDLSPDEVLKYLRKSQSDDDSLTVAEVLERHENIIDEWCENNLGGRIPEANTYREVVSGETISARPEFQEVLRRIESPKIRALTIVEPQRLSRGDLEDIGRLMKLIKHTNTLVITTYPYKIYNLKDKYDFDALERELKEGNQYLEYVKTAYKRGRERAASEGYYIWKDAPYGYDKSEIKVGKKKRHILVENKEESETVRLIFDMYVNHNMGRTAIAYKLDDMGLKPRIGSHWSPHSIADILKNYHLIGKIVWNARPNVTIVKDGEIKKIRPYSEDVTYFEGKHEAIISEELFYKAQEKRNNFPKKKKSTTLKNAMAGLIKCSCGRALSVRTVCGVPRLVCDKGRHCHSASVIYDEVIDKVKNILEVYIEDFEIKLKNDDNNAASMHASMISNLEKRLEHVKESEIKLWKTKAENRGTDEEMPEFIFKQLKDDIVKEKKEIESALDKARQSEPIFIDYNDKIMKLKDALNALNDDSVDAEHKNILLKACIQRITYTRGRAIRITKANCKEYGMTTSQGGNWYSPPFELDIDLLV